jgi:hypothetical protein
MNFESLIRYKTFDRMYEGNALLLDRVMAENSEAGTDFPVRKIQFDVTNSLFQRLESAASILNMTKREFLEAALIEGLDKANLIIAQEKLFDHLEEQQAGRA